MFRAAALVAPDLDSARDATQEAFARAYGRWRRLRAQPWAGGWVMTTAINLCRKESKRQRRESIGTEISSSTDLPMETMELREAMLKLPTRQRQAVTLFYVGDLMIQDIAPAMGISEGAVKAHLSHGRKRLRELLGG